MTRVLVTGAGGPAGVAVIRSLLKRDDVEVYTADMDGWASGLYLVPPERRRIVPRGASPEFVDIVIELCIADAIDVLFSTVDFELPSLAARRDELGPTVLAAPSLETLDVTLDKFALSERVDPYARVPVTRLVGPSSAAEDWVFPIIVKPRRGAGSRGVRLLHDRAQLVALGDDASLIAQELLPGDEFSVDVFADAAGGVIAAVPRTRSRTRVDSGVSIAGRTVRNEELEATAAAVARAIGFFGIAAAIINELSRQGRQQFASIERLAQERETRLTETLSLAEQLRENQERLHSADRLTRSVLDAVTEQSVIGTDLTGLIDVWNPGAAAMLGLPAIETQGRRHIYDFHVAEELDNRSRELNYPAGETVLNPGFSALVESARLGKAEVRDWTYVRADGSSVSVSVAVTPRVDEDGAAVGYIFVGTDVTQALEVARLKDEFVGLISHELRTPLSSILGYLELMRDDDESPLSEEQLQYLGVAERNAHLLLRLVGDLLFTAQVVSGKFPLDISQVALNDVVAAAVESARPVSSTAGVELILNLPEHSVVVRGDAVRLGQACDNLISNAVKFTPRGGTVTVSLGTSEAGAVITVRDTGIGIPEAELDKLYARFFRASTATRNAVPGVGLGLTITKAIVTAHKGELNVESEEGVGTAFSMSLPLPLPRRR